MIKRLTAITRWVMLVAVCICISGCVLDPGENKLGNETNQANPTTESVRSEIVLNQRQIAILQKQGLPIIYEQLTAKQKSAIEAIEDLLVHLENKYQSQFEYEGYVAASLLDREHLLATTTIHGEVKTIKAFRTYENGAWVYEDDYMHFVAEPAYRKTIISFFDTKIDPNGYKIFSNVQWIEGEYSETDVLKNVAAVSVLYVSKETCTDVEQVQKLMQDFASWAKEQGLQTACTIEICVVEAKDLDNVYSYNYVENISKDWVIVHKICTIDKFGGVNIV